MLCCVSYRHAIRVNIQHKLTPVHGGNYSTGKLPEAEVGGGEGERGASRPALRNRWDSTLARAGQMPLIDGAQPTSGCELASIWQVVVSGGCGGGPAGTSGNYI